MHTHMHTHTCASGLTAQLIIGYTVVLGLREREDLTQEAWSLMNDSLQTHVFVALRVEAIAVACIHLAARRLREPLPPAWWRALHVSDAEVTEIRCA
jgi:hypothetical protein